MKNITKINTKENIQYILIYSKLDYNNKFDEYHYFIFVYYNKLDQDNIFCRQLRYANNLLWHNESGLNNKISFSELSNFDDDFLESNPYNIK